MPDSEQPPKEIDLGKILPNHNQIELEKEKVLIEFRIRILALSLCGIVMFILTTALGIAIAAGDNTIRLEIVKTAIVPIFTGTLGVLVGLLGASSSRS